MSKTDDRIEGYKRQVNELLEKVSEQEEIIKKYKVGILELERKLIEKTGPKGNVRKVILTGPRNLRTQLFIHNVQITPSGLILWVRK